MLAVNGCLPRGGSLFAARWAVNGLASIGVSLMQCRPDLLRPACFPRGNDVPLGRWGEQLGTTHPTDGPADATREGRGLGCVRAERGDRGGAGRRVRRSARGAGASTW